MDEIIDQIIKKMPFRDEIVKWCQQKPDFLQAMKIANSSRFAHFAGISITTTTNKPKDQVIGIVVYDKQAQILKQDFIVDEGFTHTSFIYYTSLPDRHKNLFGSNVKHINEFLHGAYGKNGHYTSTHHPKLETLHPEIQSRVRAYLAQTGQELIDL